MNRHLFDLLRRIEDSARRLASTIGLTPDRPMRENALVDAELEEIGNALADFKAEVAAGAKVGAMPGRMIKE
jgi:hypothetical protein